MKAMIRYGCDLEDVPRTVSELLHNLKENDIPLVEIDVQDAISYSHEKNTSKAFEAIEQARIQLAKIDSRLMDYGSILNSYANTSTQLKLGIDPNEASSEETSNKSTEPTDEQETHD